jgi:hypothetical protein
MFETNIVVIHDQIPQILIPRCFSQLAPRTREHHNIARVAHIEELHREEEARKTRQVKVKNVTCEFFFPPIFLPLETKEGKCFHNK